MPDPTAYTYDVFISYSHADSEWVRRTLLPRLEGAGLKVSIDWRDFRPGAFSVKEMERAVLESRNTLLILTPNYASSRWGEFENVMLQTLDPMNEMFRLIPVLKERCDLPPRLRALTYVNFADPDDPAWPWTQLLTALGAAPIQEPPPAPERPGWFLPHPYGAQPNFTGRAAEREMLSGWLERDPGHPLLMLRALGGFGKSALAWHWLSHDVDAARWPRAVWWSFYEGDNQFDSFLRETLTYLGADLRRFPGPRQQADALLTLLRQPGTLLILDGFERALRAFSSLMAAYQGDETNQQIGKSANRQIGKSANRQIGKSANRQISESANQRISESAKSQIRNPQSAIRNPQSERDCVSPVAEHFLRSLATLPGLRGKVLMTTRLRPRIVEGHGEELLLGCCERELTQMDPGDAVAFFRGQGIRGGRAEIEAACAPYGYHPLSLRLLAGLVTNDLRQPGDIAAARRLDVAGGDREGRPYLVQRQHHVLEQAYESLPPDRRRLLSRIACFRGPVGYEALAALADRRGGFVMPGERGGAATVTSTASDAQPANQTRPPRPGVLNRLFGRGGRADGRVAADATLGGSRGSESFADEQASVERGRSGTDAPETRPYDLDADLHDLLSRGLLHRDHRTNRFDLHPIVRRYAYDRLAGDDRAAAHRRLRDYFAAVPPPEQVRTLDDLAPVIELYHHTVAAGQYDEAITLFRDRISQATYYQFGAYQLRIELLAGLFPDGEDKPPRLTKESDQAWTLTALANSYSLSGQPARAVPLFEGGNAIDEKRGDKENLAIGLGAVATVAYMPLGALAAAEANLRREIALCREIGDEFREAVGHAALGQLLAYRGALAESKRELDAALGAFEKKKAVQGVGVTWAYRALAALLMARDLTPTRSLPRRNGGGAGEGVRAARRALELADETARVRFPSERDYVRAHWLLGAALRAAGDPDEADRHLTEALARCRGINLVDHEADILLDLARVRWDEGREGEREQGGGGDELRAEALRLAGEALVITERSGYVLQGADVHLFLAEIEMARGDRAEALRHAQAARRLAECDGPPDGTYKVAYDEASTLLAKLEAA